MNNVRRLKAVGAVLALAAVVTSAHVWGEPTDKSQERFRTSSGLLPPDKNTNQFGEDLTECKFADRAVLTYRTQSGDTLFALQVQPKLDAGPARPRDLLILVDTSASQAGRPLTGALALAKALVAAAAPGDRVALMTANTPSATRDLTKGFQAPNAPAVGAALAELQKEIPLGDTDLRESFKKAASLFGGQSDRQQAVVFVGDGMSLHNPLSAAERAQLCDDLVRREIAVFPVPAGPRLDPTNLHALATFTGGSVVRVMPKDAVTDTVKRLQAAFAVPVVYPTKFDLAGPVVEAFPTKLPPLRADSPTLVVGTLKQVDRLGYSLEGMVAGKNVRVEKSEQYAEPEPVHFFLVNMVNQWRQGKEHPALTRADRALSFAHEQGHFARADLLAKAEWALAEFQIDAAQNLFDQAKKLDPHDAEADAGLKVVRQLRDGNLKPEQLREQAIRGAGDAIRIGKGADGKVKVTRDRLLALAQQPEKPAAPPAPAAEREDLIQMQRQRQTVVEQQVRNSVDDEVNRASRLLTTDPDGAREILKRMLNEVRDNPIIGDNLRRDLLARLETQLRNAEVVGARILREADERAERLAVAIQRRDDIQRQETEQIVTERRMVRFQHLFATARYQDAAMLANDIRVDHINRGAPVPVAVTAGYDIALASQNLRELEELRRQREHRFLLTMMQVERAHIPFPDEPPIEFPNIAFWREITAMRKEKYENQGLTEDDPSVLRQIKSIREKLNKPVNLPKGIDPNTPLKDALEFLSELHDITILIDTAAFKAGMLAEPEQAPVGLPKMTNVSFATVLRLLLAKLEPAGTYLVRRDYIEVTTAERAVLEKTIRAYPVADLVFPIPNSFNQQSVLNQATIFGFAGAIGAAGIGGGFAGIGGFAGLGGIGGFAGLGGIGGFAGFPGGFGGGFGFPGGIGGIGGIGGLAGIGGIGGALGIAGGGLAGQNAGFGGAAGFAGAGGGQQNLGVGGGPAGFGGGQLGQFGNLGGQFGLQGGDQSQILIQLIRQVVGTAQDWAPIRGVNRIAQGGGALPPGVPEPDEPAGDVNTANDLGYYPPAQALIVKATSRFHTRIGGPLTTPRIGAPGGGLGGLKMNPDRDGEKFVIKPGDRQQRLANIAARNTAPPKPAVAKTAPAKAPAAGVARHVPPDPKEWHEKLKDVTDPGLIIACADFLAQAQKFDHVAELLKANLRYAIVVKPWVYETLALALEASGAAPADLERAQVSAADIEPGDALGMVRAAQALAEHKRFDRALAYCRQAALLEPSLPDTYEEALRFAELDANPRAMEWAAANLLGREWSVGNDNLHGKARERVKALRQALAAANRNLEADRLATAVGKLKERDLVLNLRFDGDADVDMLVKEPIGTFCSSLNRQSANGGVFVGDSVTDRVRDPNKPRESYVAAQAFPGDYEVTLRRIWGRPTGSKAILEIIRHQGTDREQIERRSVVFDREHKLTIRLEGGRRTALEHVAPPALQHRAAALLADRGSPDRVLNKLRALADPDVMGVPSGVRGGVAGLGTPAERRTPRPGAERRGDEGYQAALGRGGDVLARAVVSADGQRVEGYRLHPVFQAMGKPTALRPAVVNPTIPGAADPFGK